MQQKRRHHYVPVALSKRFVLSPDDKRFFYYDVEKNSVKPTSPTDAFRIKDYHTLEKEGGKKDRSTIEDEFMNLEGAGASAITLFTEAKELTNEKRSDLAAFCALQLVIDFLHFQYTLEKSPICCAHIVALVL